MVHVTWTPPIVPNGIIYQYIVQRVNSSGKFYHHVPANQHTISLPYFNDALVFIAAINLYGQSEYKLSQSQGIVLFIVLYYYPLFIVVPCLPSPCLNGGICLPTNGTSRCSCIEIYSGLYCERVVKVHQDSKYALF